MGIQRLTHKIFSSISYISASQLLLCFLILLCVKVTAGSYGDRSYIFMKCVSNCGNKNCTSQSKFLSAQPWYLTVLQWSCKDECRYQCMWKTVDAFHKDGLSVPQFHGKWPFVRLFGIQEPASVLFSVLNGLAHLRILSYRKQVSPKVPLYYIWHLYALVAFNAWFWSTVFHTKDTDFTEKMDYFCAFSVVLSNCYAVLCRSSIDGYETPDTVFILGYLKHLLYGTSPVHRPLIFAALVIALYTYHIYYLAFVHFDYGYNMQVNIFLYFSYNTGALNFAGWMLYAYKEGIKKRYVQKCMLAMFGLTFLILLELLDFPPLLWIFDAHSMWHAGTIPVCYLWYSFVIEDGLNMQLELGDDKDKKTV